MKIILNIPDNKASFFLEVLKNFSFVKAEPVLDEKHLSDIEDLKDNLKRLDNPDANFHTVDELDNMLEKRIKKYEN